MVASMSAVFTARQAARGIIKQSWGWVGWRGFPWYMVRICNDKKSIKEEYFNASGLVSAKQDEGKGRAIVGPNCNILEQ